MHYSKQNEQAQDDARPQATAVPYLPFPIHTLPGPVGRFVAAASAAIGCDPSFVALPLLACLARAIGNKRTIRLKRTWTEPAIIWAAIIGKSGTHKTPALQASMQFLQRRQGDAIKRHLDAVAQYEKDLVLFHKALQAWSRSKKDEPPPTAPREPVCDRYVTTDCTIEALAVLLAEHFDGILVNRDELASWLGGIAEYKGGKGSDLGHWLAAWSGTVLTVDRKTGDVKMLHVPRACVSLIGGIQPGVLRTAIGREHMQDGLCARLLVAMPDPRPVRWTDATVSPTVEAALGAVFDRLLALDPAVDDEGRPEPLAVDMSPEAKKVWVEYYNRHRAESAEFDEDLAAAWSKLEAYTARFALIIQFCFWAAGEAGGDGVDEASMSLAIELSDWFGGEARRVYGVFAESDEECQRRELVEIIGRKGGGTTPRDLAHSSRRYRKAGEAQAALEGLVKLDLGHWEVESTGGRPSQRFVLNDFNAGNGNESLPNTGNSELPLPLPLLLNGEYPLGIAF